MLVDPIRLASPPSKVLLNPVIHAQKVRRLRVRVDKEDVLLAVVHGFGSKGWRDHQATQTYVLKGVADGNIGTRPYKRVIEADNKDKLPRVWGDVIAQTIGGQSGFVYYNGGKYAWYDPRSFKPSTPGRMGHGQAMR